MLQFRHPSVKPVDFAAMQLYTKSCTGLLSNIESLTTAPLHKANKGNNNGKMGDVFEAVVYNELVLRGVSIDRMMVHVSPIEIRGNNKNVDCDIVVLPVKTSDVYVIFAKKSLRERWKQFDRDCWALRTHRDSVAWLDGKILKAFGLFHCENPKNTPESMIKLAKKRTLQSISDMTILTVMDTVAMESLLVEISAS